MKIFLTGGTGFIGSNFLNLALNEGHEVIALRRSESSFQKIKLIKNPKWLNSKFEDVKLDDLKGCDILVHLAAHNVQPPSDSLEECIKNNLTKPKILFRNAMKAGIKNYLLSGSSFEYGHSGLRYDYIPPDAPLEPITAYGKSKAAASKFFIEWAKNNNLSLSIKRIFHTYGEGENANRFYPSMVRAALEGRDFHMTKGEQIRDFIEVKKVCNLLLDESLDLVNEINSKIIVSNLGSGLPIKLFDFANNFWIKNNPKGKLIVGAIPYRDDEIMRYVPNIRKKFFIN